jgi:hypothetical protein
VKWVQEFGVRNRLHRRKWHAGMLRARAQITSPNFGLMITASSDNSGQCA